MTFNLEILIRIKVYEAIYIACPVGISWFDPVRPLSGHDSLGLCSVDNLNIILIIYVVIGVLRSSTELLDGDIFVSLVEVRLSHDLLQYLTLVLVDDCLRDDATSDLLKEIVHKRYSNIKLGPGSTKLNGIVGVERTNVVRGADLIKLILL
jgi:hypothetical protein